MNELRLALRGLRRRPAFVAMSVLTFGLGVGAVTAVYSVVDAVLVEPLPFDEADRLVRVWSAWPVRGVDRGTVSPLDLEDWQDQSGTLEHLGGYSNLPVGGIVVTGDGPPVELNTLYVTPGFFEVLSVPALQGRTLGEEDHVEGENRRVVLSHGAWQQHFGGDPEAVGETFETRDGTFLLAGVMPAAFEFPTGRVDAWAPTSLIPPAGIPRERYVRWLAVVGRRASDASIEAARAEMATIANRLAAAYPDSNEELTEVTILPLRDILLGPVRPALLALLAGVALLLVIACANVASIAVARTGRRSTELAVRSAIGASGGRIASGLVLEMLLLAILGGLVGLAFGIWGAGALAAMAPTDLPRLREVGLDVRVLAVTCVALLAAGLLSAIPAVLQARRLDLASAFKSEGRTTGAKGGGRARNALLVAQVGLVTVLAIGGSLLLRSYQELLSVDPGLRSEGVLTLGVHAAGDDFADYLHQVLDRVRQLPGVDAAGMVRPLPLGPQTFGGEAWAFTIPDREAGPDEGELEADLRFASPGYFTAMGIPLLAGRAFEATDGPPSAAGSAGASGAVAVVSRSAADQFWPGESPVGTRILAGSTEMEVVGVVGDVRQTAVSGEPEPAFYVPHRQVPRRGMTIAVRGESPSALAGPVQRAIWELRPDQPISDLALMQDVVGQSLARPRFAATLFSVFAGLALVLAGVGAYGVTAAFVAARRREIGIRRALGASAGTVFRGVVGRGVQVAAVGVGIGIVLALALTRALGSLLYGVSVRDPWSFAGVAALLIGIALVAAMLPARSACRIDPASVIRSD